MDPDQLRALAPVLRRVLLDHVVNLREIRVADVLICLSLDLGLASAHVPEQRALCTVTRLSEGDVSEALALLESRGVFAHHEEEARWEPWVDPRDWRPADPKATEPIRCRHRGAAARAEAVRAWSRLRADALAGPRQPWLGPELDPQADPFNEARAEVSREEVLFRLTSSPPDRPEPVTVRSPLPTHPPGDAREGFPSAGGLSRPPAPVRSAHPPSVKVAAAQVPAGASSVNHQVSPSARTRSGQQPGAPAPVNKSDPGAASLSESLSERCRKSLGLSESLSPRPRVSRAGASDASDVSDGETSSPSDASDGSGWTGGSPDEGGELADRLAEACGEGWGQWRGWWKTILAHHAGRAAVAEQLGELKWRREGAAIGRAKPVRNAGAWLAYEVRKSLKGK